MRTFERTCVRTSAPPSSITTRSPSRISIGSAARGTASELSDIDVAVPELGRAGILPAELVGRLAGSAGLRSILVHDDLAVDHGRMFDDLTAGLGDFEEFAGAIEAMVSSGE